MKKATDILGIISSRTAAGEPFVLATVVRTVAATAAKAGAKAVILPDGTISEGWIGGGCARTAVIKAAKDALADGRPRLVSVEPPDALDKHGYKAGEEQGGVRFAKNMCPSQGTMDIFVEPVLCRTGAAARSGRCLWIQPSGRCDRRSCKADGFCRDRLRATSRASGVRRS